MAGARPLTESQVEQVIGHLVAPRDKCLFILGINTGFRISELLSIRVGDVYKNGQVVDLLKINREHMKSKTGSHSVPLNQYARPAIEELLKEYNPILPQQYLFKSRVGENQAITRGMAHKILVQAFQQANLTVSFSSHSMRKTFALWLYQKSGNNLIVTRDGLGHSDVSTTCDYLGLGKLMADEIIFNK